VLDYHLHLWEHGPRTLEATLEQVAAYCEQAQAEGVVEIAITEHLHRFRQADAVLGGWWEEEPPSAVRDAMADFWNGEVGADLDRYVEVVLAAKDAGLPVVLGLEVDFYRGRMHDVAAILDGYPFDVLLGSVHWLGAWGFDGVGSDVVMAEWDARAVEDVWDAYADSIDELADSGVCDVLAHPDLCKVAGRRPAVPDEWHARMAEAAARGGMSAEVNSNGWRKPAAEAYPAPDLLARFHAAGVPVTTATDAHRLDRVGERRGDVARLLVDAGYESVAGFRGRQRRAVPIAVAPTPTDGGPSGRVAV